MKAPAQSRQGFTLVELLVVLFIVVVAAAVVVPALVTMGGMVGDELRQNARRLQTTLRAAKMYAVTYRIDTAVAYLKGRRTDSVEDKDEDVIEGRWVVRKLREEEKALLGLDSDAYVRIQDRQGEYEPFTDGTCILTDVFAGEVGYDGEFKSWRGLARIQMVDQYGTVIEPFLGYPNDANLFFPAHVFDPSGFLKSNSSQLRFYLNVGLLPDADPSERFVEMPGWESDDVDNDGDGEVDEEDEEIAERSVPLGVYATLGRVTIEL